MGVITYHILSGVDPFRRDVLEQQIDAVVNANYKFEPLIYWTNVSETARQFIRECLTVDPTRRLTASRALEHKVGLFLFPVWIHLIHCSWR